MHLWIAITNLSHTNWISSLVIFIDVGRDIPLSERLIELDNEYFGLNFIYGGIKCRGLKVGLTSISLLARNEIILSLYIEIDSSNKTVYSQ